MRLGNTPVSESVAEGTSLPSRSADWSGGILGYGHRGLGRDGEAEVWPVLCNVLLQRMGEVG
jgi:hypothetical protein